MIRSSICLSVLVALALPMAAQSQTAVRPVLAAVQRPPLQDAAPEAAELQALIFYLQQQDIASANAEVRRLRVKFPGWVPPEDLGQLKVEQPSVEIDAIFRQIAEGQLPEARATIAATRAAYHGWTPPVDMTSLLELAEGQVKLDAALDAGDATTALTVASSVDGLLRCDRINNAWRIAKVQEAQQATEAAVSTYKAIVQACLKYPEITATLEKSDSVTSQAQLGELFEVAIKRFPDKVQEFDDLRSRLLAGRKDGHRDGAAVNREEQFSKVRPMPRPDRRSVAAASRPAAPKKVAAANPAPQRAQTVSSDWGQCLAQTEGTRNVSLLSQRGWCAYNLDRPMDALAAFRAVHPQLSGTARRDAGFGMALSYLKLNMTEDAARIAASTDFTPKQRVETESIILDQRGVRAYKRGDFKQAIGYFDALERVSGGLRRDLAMMRGYSYLNTGQRDTAREIFTGLQNQLATLETGHAIELAAAK
ncbi:hypothetical protein [Pseudorhodobacter sp.]|uniref:hypothetical protein n=1 Tax=Pseudorhodobacter sp. TaxID=1934400 RepID=UPI00264920C6|nr:hypothetical protein [Pseudorhodobacter sp.]MDN5785740.1 hypothetical protein [Pseudorhodobacter sp.]